MIGDGVASPEPSAGALRSEGVSGTNPRTALVLGLCAALLYSTLAGVRLGAQGPQYDELHQAAGSFSHLGATPHLFSLGQVGGYPVLNMPYSAAIKSHLFGFYLRLRGEFRLAEWRAFGILLVAAGLVVLARLLAAALPVAPLALVLALVASDATLLLLGRHDWGPVALAFLLRCLLLGLWLRGEASGAPRDATYATGMGVVAGLAVLEKLSSVVLLAPLALFVSHAPKGRRTVRARAALVGLALGSVPLVAINAASLFRGGELVSLRDAAAPEDGSLHAVWATVEGFFGLGAGSEAAALVLGLPPNPPLTRWESVATGLCLILAVAVGLAGGRNACGRWAVTSAAGYAAILGALLALPRPTWIHHWLLGTPLAALAAALALASARSGTRGRAARALTAALWLGCGGWLAGRAVAVTRVEQALLEGRFSSQFDPHLTALGELAERRATEALFVATDWGVATQIYCLSNARAQVVEPFWRDLDVRQVRALQQASGRPLLYLVRPEPPSGVGGERTARLEEAVAASDSWVELPLDREARSWRRLWLRKYVWAPGQPATATPPTRADRDRAP